MWVAHYCGFGNFHCRFHFQRGGRPLAVNLPDLEPGIAKPKLVTGTELLPLDPG